MLTRFILVFALLVAGAITALAQEPPTDKPAARAEVLVLGVYHMANPGRDIFNMQADDVLAPKRQAEIAQLLGVLKKFQPTKIAIEADPYGRRTQEYADYLAGKHTLSRNENDQIGYRLAKELGHKNIYPVDADGDFPGRASSTTRKVAAARRSWRRSWATSVHGEGAGRIPRVSHRARNPPVYECRREGDAGCRFLLSRRPTSASRAIGPAPILSRTGSGETCGSTATSCNSLNRPTSASW